jgi:NADPH:quinone reductase-like Zn-dependent oxidoreductase
MIARAFSGRRVAFSKLQELGSFLVGGAMADYIIVDPNHVIPLSEEYSFEEGATFFVNPLTALCMVERVKALNSKVCIVTAAAS